MTFVPTQGTISLADFYSFMPRLPDGTIPLNDDQKHALEHAYRTPLWVIAGPGTGKTHTLVWLVLKRMIVDGVPPDRVVLTTFTRKAAAELRTRLMQARQQLSDAGLKLAEDLDLSQLMLGTLHELCNEVLQRERHPDTLRVRVLGDELTQQFFVRRSRNPLLDCDDLTFWQRFKMASETDRFAPPKAKRAENASKLFNRMTENSVDVALLRASGQADFLRLADAYEQYQQALREVHRTDQAHLQQHFLRYLRTPAGEAWVGDGLTVLVDEYQDTNPIQEAIYFQLAGRRGDLTVVGDDDQSLYRFRGATVESLINFDDVCQHHLRRTPTPLYLRENRRSHPSIVNWVNQFVGKHPEMTDRVVRVRAPGKPELVSKADVPGNYPAVTAIIENSNPKAAQKVAELVTELHEERLVSDLSQVALLTFSTRETTHGIGAYVSALRGLGVPVYNPRSRRAHVDERLLALVGAFSHLLDPDFRLHELPSLPRGVPEYLNKARGTFETLVDSGLHADLVDYVQRSVTAIQESPVDPERPFLERHGGRQVTMSSLLFKLLSHEPFASDLRQADGGERIKALNQIVAEYESLYNDGHIKLEEDPDGGSRVEKWTLYNFYGVFVEGIHDGLNDPEDDEVSLQPGAVNIMTIHQSKGLEFEVVIVLRPDKQPFVSDTHEMEDQLSSFSQHPTRPAHRRSQEERAAEDAIRLFFVAYSRAKRLLVIAGQLNAKCAPAWDRVTGATYGSGRVQRKEDLVKLGVQLL